jgi:hypothetical protein
MLSPLPWHSDWGVAHFDIDGDLRHKRQAVAAPRSLYSFHHPRPSFGHLAPFVGCMAASADALPLIVPVASDAPASSVAASSARRPRLAWPTNDGENNTDNNRADALSRRGRSLESAKRPPIKPDILMKSAAAYGTDNAWQNLTVFRDRMVAKS